MFTYSEKQQLKEILVGILQEYGLIKPEKVLKTEKIKTNNEVSNQPQPVVQSEIKGYNNKQPSLKSNLPMTKEEERLYDEYWYDMMVAHCDYCGGPEHDITMSKEEWLKKYRTLGYYDYFEYCR